MGRREQAGFDMDMGLNLSRASSMTLSLNLYQGQYEHPSHWALIDLGEVIHLKTCMLVIFINPFFHLKKFSVYWGSKIRFIHLKIINAIL